MVAFVLGGGVLNMFVVAVFVVCWRVVVVFVFFVLIVLGLVFVLFFVCVACCVFCVSIAF